MIQLPALAITEVEDEVARKNFEKLRDFIKAQLAGVTSSVSARYRLTTSQALAAGANFLDFATQDWDSDQLISGAGSGVNGLFTFTCKQAGEYSFEAVLDFEQTGSTQNSSSCQAGFQKNNDTQIRAVNYRYSMSAQTTGFSLTARISYALGVGDRVRIYAASTATGASVSGGFLEIFRKGDKIE